MHFQNVRPTSGWAADHEVGTPKYLRPIKMLVADLMVSQSSLERALRLANRLYLDLEAHGHRVTIAPHVEGLRRIHFEHRTPPKKGDQRGFHDADTWGPKRPTVVYVGTVAVGLVVYEMAEDIEFKYVEDKFVRVTSRPEKAVKPTRRWDDWTRAPIVHEACLPSGRLAIRAYSPYTSTDWAAEWRESERGDLVDKLEEIRTTIEQAASTIVGLVEERDRRHEEWCRQRDAEIAERHRQEAAARRAQGIKMSHEQLLSIADAWSLVCRLEAFFNSVAAEAQGLPGNDRTALEARLADARVMLGGTDALAHFRAWRTPVEATPPEPQRCW